MYLISVNFLHVYQVERFVAHCGPYELVTFQQQMNACGVKYRYI